MNPSRTGLFKSASLRWEGGKCFPPKLGSMIADLMLYKICKVGNPGIQNDTLMKS